MTEHYASSIGSYYHHPTAHAVPPVIARTPMVPAPLILVVDDHEPSRTLAKIVLERAGFRVEEAATGAEGLRQAQLLRPALMLLDIILPEIDGWTLARLLRADPRTRDSIILALTALTGANDGARSLASGFDEVLTKPVLPRALAAIVGRYISERSRTRQPAL
ncbi:MAG TPA: response regulator [Gemmatimonadaceae bacterium]|nr:response regulator [Gemmatimonadaceae bacterium]